MRLKQEEPSTLLFAGRGPVLPPIWVGIALVIGPACLALLAPGPLTPPRMLTAAVIGGLGATLIARSWPRSTRITVNTHTRSIVTVDQQTPFTEAASYRLVAVAPRTTAGRPVYGVALAPRDEDEAVLLVATTDPAEALSDLTRAQARLPLPVRGGWGLPAAAPWVDSEPSERPPPDESLAQERGGRRRATTALLVGAVAIALGIGRTVHARMSLGEEPAFFSILLPTMGVLGLLVFAAVLGTSFTTLRLDGALLSETRLFGVTIARQSVPRDAIRGAYLVSPGGGAPCHLLLDTSDGPRAFPYDGERAANIGALLSH